jgi:hypothetical protein
MGSTAPDFLTVALAESEFRQGIAQVGEMASADDHFAGHIDRFGIFYEYIWDYGMGNTLLATARDNRSIDWEWEPSTRA